MPTYIATSLCTCVWNESLLRWEVTISGTSDAEAITLEAKSIDCNPNVEDGGLCIVSDNHWEKTMLFLGPDFGRIRFRAWSTDDDRHPSKNEAGVAGYFVGVMQGDPDFFCDGNPHYTPAY